MADQVLQEIKDRIDIVEFISSYIAVKKSGTSVKAVCPFHNEKSPSLMISPAKQIWHCFGCGEGGDAFGFLMKYENISFVEALKILADKTGVKLPVYSGTNVPDKQEKELLIRINSFEQSIIIKLCFMPKQRAKLETILQREVFLRLQLHSGKLVLLQKNFML